MWKNSALAARYGSAAQVPEDFAELRADYRDLFRSFQDLHVHMPPTIDIGVRVLSFFL